MDNKEIEKILMEIYNETLVDTVEISLTDTKPSIFESKVGGLGYIPHDEGFPVDKDGNQLRLLAQIECEKVDHPDYPKQGLLQFWIMDDDLYGCEFEENTVQNGFRIIYHKDVDRSVTEEEIKAKIVKNSFEEDESYLPVEGEYGLSFGECVKSGMTECDYRFELMFCEKYNKLNPDNPIKSMYDIDFDFDDIDGHEKMVENSFGHKIGGHPAFTQWDPRGEGDSHDFLLFQLDSEFGGGEDKVLWGDAGVGNFFINREKLKNCDFSDVIYNWDCY